MATLTTEQIEKLSSEQQETLAEVELRLARKRQELLQQTRGYRGVVLVPSVLALVGLLMLMFRVSDRAFLTFAIIALAALIQFHVTGIDRRVDAMLELLGSDIKATQPRQSKNDQVA